MTAYEAFLKHHNLAHDDFPEFEEIYMPMWREWVAAIEWERSREKWISVEDRLPECSLEPNSFGVQVLVYPPFRSEGSSEMNVAFYGCRQTDEPNFYLYGRVFSPTHWMPLPASPKETQVSDKEKP